MTGRLTSSWCVLDELPGEYRHARIRELSETIAPFDGFVVVPRVLLHVRLSVGGREVAPADAVQRLGFPGSASARTCGRQGWECGQRLMEVMA